MKAPDKKQFKRRLEEARKVVKDMYPELEFYVEVGWLLAEDHSARWMVWCSYVWRDDMDEVALMEGKIRDMLKQEGITALVRLESL